MYHTHRNLYDRSLEKTPEQVFIDTLRKEFELSPAESKGVLKLAKECLFGEIPKTLGKMLCASLGAKHSKPLGEQEMVRVGCRDISSVWKEESPRWWGDCRVCECGHTQFRIRGTAFYSTFNGGGTTVLLDGSGGLEWVFGEERVKRKKLVIVKQRNGKERKKREYRWQYSFYRMPILPKDEA